MPMSKSRCRRPPGGRLRRGFIRLKLSSPPSAESAARMISGTVTTAGFSGACPAAALRGSPKKTMKIWRAM